MFIQMWRDCPSYMSSNRQSVNCGNSSPNFFKSNNLRRPHKIKVKNIEKNVFFFIQNSSQNLSTFPELHYFFYLKNLIVFLHCHKGLTDALIQLTVRLKGRYFSQFYDYIHMDSLFNPAITVMHPQFHADHTHTH